MTTKWNVQEDGTNARMNGIINANGPSNTTISSVVATILPNLIGLYCDKANEF